MTPETTITTHDTGPHPHPNEPALPSVCMWCGETIAAAADAVRLEPGRMSHAPACDAALVVALNAAELDDRGETAFCALAYDAVRSLQADGVWILGWSQIRERAWRRLADRAAAAGYYPSTLVRRRLNDICRRAWLLSKTSIRAVQIARAREEHRRWCAEQGLDAADRRIVS